MTYRKKHKVEVDFFVKACHRVSELQYVTDHGGNLAWRVEEDLVLITPTMMNKGDIRARDLVFLDLSGRLLEGDRPVTSERGVYLTLFKARPDIRAIIHSHPPHTSGFAITRGENWLLRPLLAEAVLELGPVPVVPYAEPATQTLANRFLPYLERHNSFLMENHGVLTMTPGDIAKAVMLVDLLELTSMSILDALKLGGLKEISKEGLRNLENLRRRGGIPLPGRPGVNTSLADLYHPVYPVNFAGTATVDQPTEQGDC